jgi:hypothetical protein
MAKSKKFWISEAISSPGALHKDLNVPKGEKIPMKKLKKAEKEGGKVAKRAILAETLRNFKKKK